MLVRCLCQKLSGFTTYTAYTWFPLPPAHQSWRAFKIGLTDDQPEPPRISITATKPDSLASQLRIKQIHKIYLTKQYNIPFT